MGVVGAVDKRPLTVAFLSPEWPPDNAANGIVPYVDNVTAGLRRLWHTACVLAGHSECANSEPAVFVFESQGRSALARIRDAVAFRINPSEALRQRFSNALVRATRRAIAERGVELLEMEESLGLVQLVKPQLPIPVVVRLHGPHFANGAALGVPADAAFRRRVRNEGIGIAKADGVSAPSRDVLERTRAYYGLPLTGAVLIPAPTPAVAADQRWSLTDCDQSGLLFVGRFDRHKGGDVVIDAFCRVARRFPEIRLWLAGPDKGGFTDERGRNWTPSAYISERAPDLAGRIDCLGWQSISSLAKLRRKAFATIVASRYENFPMAVLEAMRYGCPLAATRTGGIVEIIEDGENGVLAQPGDPDDLATAIIRLLEAPEFAANLGRRAAEDVIRLYHPDVVARDTAAFHQSVIDSWNRRTS
jgi:glycosyltransferase involved in cell wall biosynthesis